MTDINRREFAGARPAAPGAGARHRRRRSTGGAPRSSRRRRRPRRARQGARRGGPSAIRRPAARGRPRDDHPPDQDRSRRADEDAQGGARQRRRARLRVLRAASGAGRERSPRSDHSGAGPAAAWPQALVGRAHGAFSRPAGAPGPDLQCGRDGASRAGAGGGTAARSRAQRRATIGGRCTAFPTAPRTCWRPRARPPPGAHSPIATSCFEGDATVVRRLREAGAVLCGQARHGRAGGRHGLQPGVRELHRPGQLAVGPGPLVGRLLERLGIGGRRRTGPLRDRLGDLGLDPVPGRLLRRHRPAADLRAGEPSRRHGAELDHGQARPARPHGRGLRARPRGHRRARSRRSLRARRPVRRSRLAPAEGSAPHRRAAGHPGQDPARGPPELRGVARRAAPVRGHRGGPGAARLPLRRDGGDHHRRRGGERLRAAVPERTDHRAHRARGPHRRLCRAGASRQGLPARAAAAAAGRRRRWTGCWPRWTPSRRRACRPSPGPSTPPFDKVYPDYPGRDQHRRRGQPLRRARTVHDERHRGSGLPTSLQLTGRARAEAALLAIGPRYQQLTEIIAAGRRDCDPGASRRISRVLWLPPRFRSFSDRLLVLAVVSRRALQGEMGGHRPLLRRAGRAADSTPARSRAGCRPGPRWRSWSPRRPRSR